MIFFAAALSFWMGIAPLQGNSIMDSVAKPDLIHPPIPSFAGWLFICTGLFLLVIALYYVSIWIAVIRGPASITLKKNTENGTIQVWENGRFLKTFSFHLITNVFIERQSCCGVSYFLQVVDCAENTLLSLELTPLTDGKIADNDISRMISFLTEQGEKKHG